VPAQPEQQVDPGLFLVLGLGSQFLQALERGCQLLQCCRHVGSTLIEGAARLFDLAGVWLQLPAQFFAAQTTR